MKERASRYLLAALFVLLPVLASILGIYFLYTTALAETRDRLEDILTSQTRMIATNAAYNRQYPPEELNHRFNPVEATRYQIRQALRSYPGIGKSGEFLLGRHFGDFLLLTFRQRAADPEAPLAVPEKGRKSEAMERALAGQSGVIRTLDYQGKPVLAAFQPLPWLERGIVVKEDLATLQRPYWQAGWLTGLCGVVLGLIGAGTYLGAVSPLWRALRAREHSLRALLGNLPGMVFRSRNAQSWPLEYVSEGSREVTGFEPDALMRTENAFAGLVHADDRERIRTAIADAVAEERSYEATYRILDAEGRMRWVWERGRAVTYPGETGPHLEGFVTDVTAMWEATETRDRLLALLDAAPDPVALADPEARPLYLNAASREMLGIPEESPLAGRSLVELYPPRLRDWIRGEVLPAAREQGVWQGEAPFLCPDGTERPATQVILAHYDSSGAVAWYSLIAHDLSQRKEAEELARKRLGELAHAARLSTAGEMATQLTHELNQPLAAITAGSQAARNYLDRSEPNYDKVREILSQMQDQALRTGEVINRLRAYLRKDWTQWRTLDLNAVLEEVSELTHLEIAAKGARLETALAPSLPPVYGEPTLIKQVVLNLIRNAAEALAESDSRKGTGRILLEARLRDPDTAQVAVSDNGPGLSNTDLERIFEAYFTSKPEGMGMGLRISLSIIETHEGKLWAESGREGGATFRFTLPIAEEG
ncbi:PAS domain-containing sensor histidine kinase [Thiohalorhabdus sp. Cl-TMA]|uniref:histidine kinase n=1 Tax=Thiohalorhabdus methylotrophus TaxID=3242694 RepID=A0ABV4TUA3_9GAMM